MLYDKPIAELMIDAQQELSNPCSPDEVVAWFAQRYPLVEKTSVDAHIDGLTVNNPSRRYHPSLARRTPLFYKEGRGRLRRLFRYDPQIHSAGGNESVDVSDPDIEAAESDLASEVGVIEDSATMEFALEAYLEEFIVTNWHLIDWGRRLEIWHGPNGENGHQLSTPVGRLDFLAKDLDTGVLVVIELKRGRTSDQVIGQAARYMGWLRERLAGPDEPVEGIIIAGDADERLYYATTAVPGLAVYTYQISFTLEPARAPTQLDPSTGTDSD